MALRILVTAPPGTGKTTLCSKVTDELAAEGYTLSGFLCHERRDSWGRRAGFDLVSLDGSQRAPLADVDGPPSGYTVGKYHVRVEEMEAFTFPILDAALNTTSNSEANKMFVFDEIGKMELFSEGFVHRVRQLLRSRDAGLHVLGTVALRGGGLIAESKRIQGVNVLEIDNSNRNSKAQEMIERFLSVASCAGCPRQTRASNHPASSNPVVRERSGTTSNRRWQAKKVEAAAQEACDQSPKQGSIAAFGKAVYGQIGQKSFCEGCGDVKSINLADVDGSMAQSDVTHASLGFDHSGFVADGKLLMFGKNHRGQCAQPSAGQRNDKAPSDADEDLSFPARARGLPAAALVRAVCCGGDHTLALLESGDVWACGDHSSGQCGHGVGVPKFTSSFSKVESLGAADSVSCGFKHSAAICQGALYVWGNCGQGQLGLGGRKDQALPVQLDMGAHVCQVSLGRWHSLVLTSANEVWAFGWGRFGVLGQGNVTDHRSPAQVKGLSGQGKVHSLAAGAVHNGAVVGADRKLFMWGRGSLGRLGLGTEANSLLPAALPSLDQVDHIAMGGDFSIARSAGRWFVWGKNNEGQLGLGDSDRETCLLPKENPMLQGFSRVFVGDCHAIALQTAEARLLRSGIQGESKVAVEEQSEETKRRKRAQRFGIPYRG